MDFIGKIAIVTGGVQGIGKAISTALLKRGMKLLVCDINEQAGKLFIEEVPDNSKPNVIYQKCDVASYEQLKDVFVKTKTSFGRIDVVVNNAGVINEHQWKKMIEINFIGVIHGIHLAFEFMGTNNGGSGGFVINTASVAGLGPFALIPIYSGCKHGVVGLTKSYGLPYHYDKTGVSVNALCPCPVDTQMFSSLPSSSVDEKRSKELVSTFKPVSPDEVAQAAIKLLQDGRNGSLLEVDNEGFKYVE